MATSPHPLAVPDDLYQEVRETASETRLSMADVLRQSIKLGLPKLRAQHAPERELKPFTRAEAAEAFARDSEWERLEAAMARRPVRKPEAD
jgi:Arc/MetJ-type ribon-helix-helix transcriptional regulator